MFTHTSNIFAQNTTPNQSFNTPQVAKNVLEAMCFEPTQAVACERQMPSCLRYSLAFHMAHRHVFDNYKNNHHVLIVCSKKALYECESLYEKLPKYNENHNFYSKDEAKSIYDRIGLRFVNDVDVSLNLQTLKRQNEEKARKATKEGNADTPSWKLYDNGLCGLSCSLSAYSTKSPSNNCPTLIIVVDASPMGVYGDKWNGNNQIPNNSVMLETPYGQSRIAGILSTFSAVADGYSERTKTSCGLIFIDPWITETNKCSKFLQSQYSAICGNVWKIRMPEGWRCHSYEDDLREGDQVIGVGEERVEEGMVPILV